MLAAVVQELQRILFWTELINQYATSAWERRKERREGGRESRREKKEENLGIDKT